MIFTGIAPKTPFYRALTPRWAYRPESGEGAAIAGGRFNRPGIAARYLADSPKGALKEYQQAMEYLPPATLATYLVSADRIVDFSKGYDPKHWSEAWEEALENWKEAAFFEDTEPASWLVSDLVRAADAAGILYPSTRNPGTLCLVLYPDKSQHFSAPVHDPSGDLPKNPNSWR